MNEVNGKRRRSAGRDRERGRARADAGQAGAPGTALELPDAL